MTWLVTGASGFLGGHVVEALVARGTPVRVFVRASSDTPHLDALPVERVVGSLEDPDAVHAAVDGMDRVIHCGGLAADWGPLAAFEAANVVGMRHLADAALAAGVGRVVHVSTTDVYGHPGRDVDEEAPFVMRGWPYGDTKIAGEREAWAAAERGLPLVVVRPANIWGPRCVPFVTEIVEMMSMRAMPRIGGGRTDAGLCYVANAVDALLRVAEHPAAPGRAYNLHDGTGMPWRRYLEALAEAAGTPAPWFSLPTRPTYALGWAMERVWGAVGATERPPLTRVAVQCLGTTQGFSTARIRQELGWAPRVSFDEGMERVRAWLTTPD